MERLCGVSLDLDLVGWIGDAKRSDVKSLKGFPPIHTGENAIDENMRDRGSGDGEEKR